MLDNPDVHVTINDQKIYLINIIKEFFRPFLDDRYYANIDRAVRSEDVLIGCSCWIKYKTKLKKPSGL